MAYGRPTPHPRKKRAGEREAISAGLLLLVPLNMLYENLWNLGDFWVRTVGKDGLGVLGEILQIILI